MMHNLQKLLAGISKGKTNSLRSVINKRR